LAVFFTKMCEKICMHMLMKECTVVQIGWGILR